MNIPNIHEMNVAKKKVFKKVWLHFREQEMPNVVVTQICCFSFSLNTKKAQINNLYLYICTHTYAHTSTSFKNG